MKGGRTTLQLAHQKGHTGIATFIRNTMRERWEEERGGGRRRKMGRKRNRRDTGRRYVDSGKRRRRGRRRRRTFPEFGAYNPA